jgi:hypothetical protein
MHRKVLVQFDVDGVLKTIEAVIGVKQLRRLAWPYAFHFLHGCGHGDVEIVVVVRAADVPLST